MLSLSEPYRRLLWEHDNWSLLLEQRAREFFVGDPSAEKADEAAELAAICEAVNADNSVAVLLYDWAYNIRPEKQWAERCRLLAEEGGDLAAVARVLMAQFEHTREPSLLPTTAMALLDAGMLAQACEFIHMARTQEPSHSHLLALGLAAEGDCSATSEFIANIEAEARGSGSLCVRAELLLTASRLATLAHMWAEAEIFLVLAFEADSRNERVYALLENLWVSNRQWERLGTLYRTRTQGVEGAEAKAEGYRRAGVRMITRSESPGIGVRLLQQANTLIYQQEIDPVPKLVGILGLLTETLASTGDAPSAVRILAQALARPRTNDEAMWIVNRGLALAEGDVALKRTVANFESLKNNLLANHSAQPVPTLEAELRSDLCERGQVRTNDLPPRAKRAIVTADVSIEVRAQVIASSGRAVGITRDLSTTGVFISCQLAMAMGESIRLSMLLPGDDEWSFVEHDLSGVVVRVESGVGYGIRFTSIPENFVSDIERIVASDAR